MDDRIGILGTGDVGRALATGFAGRGWGLVIRTRYLRKLDEWLGDTEGTIADPAGSFTTGSVAALVRRFIPEGAATSARR